MGKSVVEQLTLQGINCVASSKRDGVDFLNLEQTNELFAKEKFDAVINCAAVIGGLMFVYQHQGEVYYQNVILNMNLMEAARLNNVKMYVNPLANCSYPGHLNIYDEDQWWDGQLHESVLSYGFSKKVSWVQSWSYQNQYGFQTTNLILPNMYGPGDYFNSVRSHALGSLIFKFVEAKEKNKPYVEVWGDGTPIREWLYVKDAAKICVKALNSPPDLGPINIGIGKGISILELANIIKETVGYQGQIQLDPSKPNGAASKIMKVDRMKKVFDWEPPTPLRQGIQEAVAWYLKNK